jgi:hypothetical protein
MTKVAAGITTSLDGYITGSSDRPGRGLGEGGEWSQPRWERPPTWSQFGRHPATREQPTTRHRAAELR